jgi:hypothetical protein
MAGIWSGSSPPILEHRTGARRYGALCSTGLKATRSGRQSRRSSCPCWKPSNAGHVKQSSISVGPCRGHITSPDATKRASMPPGSERYGGRSPHPFTLRSSVDVGRSRYAAVPGRRSRVHPHCGTGRDLPDVPKVTTPGVARPERTYSRPTRRAFRGTGQRTRQAPKGGRTRSRCRRCRQSRCP